MKYLLKLFGYPLINLGKLLIRLGVWCLGGTVNIEQQITYDADEDES